MQATVYRFDPATGSGAVLTDEGSVLAFGPDAWATSGLRHLRAGQRLSLERDPAGLITGLHLGTIRPQERPQR